MTLRGPCILDRGDGRGVCGHEGLWYEGAPPDQGASYYRYDEETGGEVCNRCWAWLLQLRKRLARLRAAGLARG